MVECIKVFVPGLVFPSLWVLFCDYAKAYGTSERGRGNPTQCPNFILIHNINLNSQTYEGLE